MRASLIIVEARIDSYLFESPLDWLLSKPDTFMVAARSSILRSLIKQMAKKDKKWSEYSREECLLVAKSFKRKCDWRQYHHRSFHRAESLGIVDECCAGMTKPKSSNTVRFKVKNKDRKFCLESASCYRSPREWESNARDSLKTSINNDWFNECIQLMQVEPKDWTMQICVTLCLHYGDSQSWKKGNPKSFEAANVNGWYDYCLFALKQSRDEPLKPSSQSHQFAIEGWIKKRKAA